MPNTPADTTPDPTPPPAAPEPAPTPDPTPPSPEPTPEPTPAPAPEPPPAPVDWNLRDAAKGSGLNVAEFDTDESLATAMFAALGQAQKDQPFVTIGQQFAPYADKLSDIQKWQQEQTAPTPEPEPAAPTFKWDAPEYDPRWPAMVELDERGFYKAPEGIPSSQPIAEKMNTFRQFQTKTLEGFLRDPQELIGAATADPMAEMEARLVEQFNKSLDERFAKQTAEAEMTDYWSQREKDFWQHDENGTAKLDAQNQPIPTPKGLAAGEYNAYYADRGYDEDEIRRSIDRDLQLDEFKGRFGEPQPPPTPATPLTPAPPTAPEPATKKKTFLRRIGANGSRGGSVPDPTAPAGTQQNPGAQFSDITARIAKEQGVPLSG